jgi:hypothetical protein
MGEARDTEKHTEHPAKMPKQCGEAKHTKSRSDNANRVVCALGAREARRRISVRYGRVEKNREERNSCGETRDSDAERDVKRATCRELYHCCSGDGAHRAIRNLKWTFLCHAAPASRLTRHKISDRANYE